MEGVLELWEPWGTYNKGDENCCSDYIYRMVLLVNPYSFSSSASCLEFQNRYHAELLPFDMPHIAFLYQQS